jgi:CRISPR-associated protein Csx17
MFAAGAARRHGSALQGAMVAPFTAVTTGVGYGSAMGNEKGRAELWLPLWPRWASLSEIETVARESRAQVGRRQARDGLDFVRAAGELGVARGIEAFERYAILERSGQSGLAVPAGRIEVSERPRVAALRTIDPWLDRFRRYARGDCPAAIAEAARRLERALFDFANTGTPETAGRLLEELGRIESTLAVAGGRVEEQLRPMSRVPAAVWIDAADDGSGEFAAAVGIASLRDANGALPAMRDYLHGTTVDASSKRTYAGRARLAAPRRGAAETRLAAIHARRHLDAARADRRARLRFDRGTWVPAWVASGLATGAIDAERVVRLAGGLSLFDLGPASVSPGRSDGDVDPAYALLALAWFGVPDVVALEPRPGWAARLAAGRTDDVLREAVLRLRMAELRPLADADDLVVGAPSGTRLAAALMLSIRDRDRRRLASSLLAVEARPTTEGATT